VVRLGSGQPPKTWRAPLTLAAVSSVLLVVVDGTLTWQRRSQESAFDQKSTAMAFGVVVGVEFAAAGIGAALLARRDRSEFVAVWIAVVVGVQVIPLACLLEHPLFHAVGIAVIAVALGSVPVPRSRELAPSAVTEIGTGAVLLAAALYSLATVIC
jgi:hypothetical protein